MQCLTILLNYLNLYAIHDAREMCTTEVRQYNYYLLHENIDTVYLATGLHIVDGTSNDGTSHVVEADVVIIKILFYLSYQRKQKKTH